jgi:hypothetical protein
VPPYADAGKRVDGTTTHPDAQAWAGVEGLGARSSMQGGASEQGEGLGRARVGSAWHLAEGNHLTPTPTPTQNMAPLPLANGRRYEESQQSKRCRRVASWVRWGGGAGGWRWRKGGWGWVVGRPHEPHTATKCTGPRSGKAAYSWSGRYRELQGEGERRRGT